MDAERNAPSAHRRALRYIVECAHGGTIGQLPSAIVIWLVSDSFRSSGLRTYRCGGSVGFAPTSHSSDAALDIARASHRTQLGRSMTGDLRLVKQQAAIVRCSDRIFSKGNSPYATPTVYPPDTLDACHLLPITSSAQLSIA